MTFKQYHNQIKHHPKCSRLNFNKVDGRYYYVYRVTSIYDGTHYYGSRVSVIEPKKDFWSYGTSSSQIGRKNHIIECNYEYKLKIVKIFDNNGMKILWEAYLHHNFDVRINDKFWNKANQTSFGLVSCSIIKTGESVMIDNRTISR